jgi:hypothetical protein
MKKLLLLLACLFCAAPSEAAFTFIASVTAGSSNNTSVTTAAMNTTGANLLVGCTSSYNNTNPRLTDSAGNTWYSTPYHGGGAARGVELFYAVAPVTSATHTFSLSTASSYPSLTVAAFSGAAARNLLDSETGSLGTGVTTLGGANTVTPTNANSLILSCLTHDFGGGTASAAGGSLITVPQTLGVNNQHIGSALAYEIQTTATARAATWTWTGSTDGSENIMVFNVAGTEPALTGRMKQETFGVAAESALANGTNYHTVMYQGSGFGSDEASLSKREVTLTHAATYRNLRVSSSTSLSSGTNERWTLLVDGAATALQVIIGSGSGTSIVDNTITDVHVAAGHRVVLQRVAENALVAHTALWSLEVESDTANLSYGAWNGNATGIMTTGTYSFAPFTNGSSNVSVTRVALAGSVVGHSINLTNAPGVGQTRTVYLEKNGVTQDGTGGSVDTRVVVSDTATSAYGTFSLPVVAGDLLVTHQVGSGGAAASYGGGSIAFLSTSRAYHVPLETAATTPGPDFTYPAGQSSASGNLTDNLLFIGSFRDMYFMGIRATQSNTPGGTGSWTWGVNINTSSAGVSTLIVTAGLTAQSAAVTPARLRSTNNWSVKATAAAGTSNNTGTTVVMIIATDNPGGFNALLVEPEPWHP